MDKSKILSVLNDEQLLERFGNTLIDEINNDDESFLHSHLRMER